MLNGRKNKDISESMNSLVQSMNNKSPTEIVNGVFLSPKIASSARWLLILAILYLLVQFGWSIWAFIQPRPVINVSTVAESHNKESITVLNVRQLMAINLFGDSKASNLDEVDSNVLNAPVTRLKLKLRGVYSAEDEQLAGAMIEAQNKQDVYRIGASLPGASGLKLYKIMSDRVIMSRSGKFETLLIEDFSGTKTASSGSHLNTRNRQPSNLRPSVEKTSSDNNIIDKRSDSNLTNELNKLRSKLTDPQSLSELISVSPAMENDEFSGFRIAPGKNRALFGRLGLRRNDVITGVNGIGLNDPAGAFSLMEQISTADEINLSIKRGDRNMNILFSAQAQ